MLRACVYSASSVVRSSTTTLSRNLMASAAQSRPKVLSVTSINPHVVAAEYAVRGAIPIRAEELANQLKSKPGSLPFSQITRCNIGNPQELGQAPLTYIRQVCSLLENPEILADDKAVAGYPQDIVARARQLKTEIGSTGAYTHSQGITAIRNRVAQFMINRDGAPASPDNIFLTDGASAGVKALLQLIIRNPNSGILIPIPQYPLYSATLTLFDGKAVPYYLEEERGWGFSAESVRSALKTARASGTDVRALVIINPGNPTGGCLSRAEMEEVLLLCQTEGLVLMADEVYQTNVYDTEAPWQSFKKVLFELGAKVKDVELVSYHSVSKGFIGECGKRGGYMELVNFDADVVQQIYKNASISLCPNVLGQVVVDLMVDPPKPGDESYAVFAKERDSILASLKRRAELLVKSFNELEGVSCQPARGAMYTFPQITLSKKAVAAAAAAKMAPDAFYCMQLLEATGVCTVPGSGFRQREGTHHFRCTFLPPENSFQDFIQRIKVFHAKFMDTYRD